MYVYAPSRADHAVLYGDNRHTPAPLHVCACEQESSESGVHPVKYRTAVVEKPCVLGEMLWGTRDCQHDSRVHGGGGGDAQT